MKDTIVMHTDEELQNIFDGFMTSYELTHNWDNDATVFACINNTWTLGCEAKIPDTLLDVFVYHGEYSRAMLTMHAWATPADRPLSKVIRPSLHKDRRRCRILIMMDKGQCYHGIHWQDSDALQVQIQNGGGVMDEPIKDMQTKFKTYRQQLGEHDECK